VDKPPPDAMINLLSEDYSDLGSSPKQIKQQRRSRSNSTASDGTKKVHPRSRKNSITKEEDVVAMDETSDKISSSSMMMMMNSLSGDVSPPPVMCGAHFFTAKCTTKSCPFPHLTSLHGMIETECLQEVLNTTTSYSSATEEDHNHDDRFMPALYCVKLDHVSQLTQKISDGLIKATDIVYAVDHQKTLFYDRNRGGLLHPPSSTTTTSPNNNSTPTKWKHPPNSYSAVATTLPGLLLRQIVEFLPDVGVAAMNGVCREWRLAFSPLTGPPDDNKEYNNTIWTFLLTRNGWPGTTYEDYCLHATVVRDITALKTQGQRQQQPLVAWAHHNQQTGVPSLVLVKAWKPNQVFTIDTAATAVLYESTRGQAQQPHTKVLLRASLDPYLHTKKRTVSVIAAALDDTTIGVLAQVKSANVEARAYILILKQRDTFLLNDNDDDDDGTVVIDIGVAILNYLLSLETADHSMLQLMDFLQSHEFGDVEISASAALAACGHGRFLLHVQISIPTSTMDNADELNMEIIDRRLVLFSSDAVLWMGDSEDDYIFSLQCQREIVAMRTSHRNLVVAPLMQGAPHRISNTNKATEKIVISRTHIVSCYSFRVSPLDVYSSELRFYPAHDHFSIMAPQQQPPLVVKIDDSMSIEDLSCVRLDHLVVLCIEHAENVNRVDGAMDGRGNRFWRPDQHGAKLWALIMYIPTQTMIRSIDLGSSVVDVDYIPQMIEYVDQTVALCSKDGTMWMSGTDVLDARVQVIEAIHNNSSTKKKKKRQPTRGGKKDGFARGMSLRG
jgi:hypothetical protein